MKGSKWKLLLRFFPYVKPYLPLILVISFLGMLQLGVSLVGPWMAKIIVDRILVKKDEAWSLGKAIFLLGIAFLMGIILQIIRNILVVKLSTQMITDLRGKLYMHLQRLSQRFYDTRQAGSVASRVIQDVNGAERLISEGFIGIIADVLLVILAGFIIVYLQWKLAVICLCLFPLYILSFKKFNGTIHRAWLDVFQQMEAISGNLVERISGMKIIQSFNQEKHEFERLNEQFGLHAHKTRFAWLMTNMYGSVNQMINNVGKLMFWSVGVLFVLNGELTIGGLIAFQAYLALLSNPISRFSNTNVTVQNSLAHIKRIFEVLDTEPDIHNKTGALSLLHCRGDIRYENITFSYSADQLNKNLILKGISFHAKPGEVIALVGLSGAGKSTLVQLIPRLYDPDSGRVILDGTDIREYDLHDLRKHISLVLQDDILFSGTIYENICYANPNASRDQVIAAAKAANVDNFVMNWEHEYETVVGEKGMRLSGGQKQRVAIARALLNDPRILILDEATSALDAESEALVTEALSRVMIGRTTLIIAHRLATVVRADQILVLSQGEIVERGRHHELLAQRGIYRELFEKQLNAMRPEDLLQTQVPIEQMG